MTTSADPTEPIRAMAAGFEAVDRGTSCTQASFKAGGPSFLFIGPGPRRVGFKAMFKLDGCMAQAWALATESPGRFEIGKNGWVTARFTSEEPLPRSIWETWLRESYCISTGTPRD